MTDSAADGLEGDFLTVEQLAQLRQVTPAAIRAQLRAGNLAGEQVLQGQRTVWRIPVSVARGYLGKAGGAVPAAPPEAPPSPPGRAADVRPAPPAIASEPDPVPRTVGRGVAAPASSGRVEALETEVRRLRRQLSALAEAHRRLLDALTADLDEA
ncbi:hypothetical protein [Geodermatophilus sp. URMC 64]